MGQGIQSCHFLESAILTQIYQSIRKQTFIKFFLEYYGLLMRIDTKNWSIISYKAFVSADATNDNNIDYTELVNWIELNQQFINFLQDYEPSTPIHYDQKLFKNFYKIDVGNFEFEPLHIVVDTNRLVKHMTASSKNKMKASTQVHSPQHTAIATTQSDEQHDDSDQIVKRKLYLSGGKRRNVLASLQLNDFKHSKMIKANHQKIMSSQRNLLSPQNKGERAVNNVGWSQLGKGNLLSHRGSINAIKEQDQENDQSPVKIKKKGSLMSPSQLSLITHSNQNSVTRNQTSYNQKRYPITTRGSPRRIDSTHTINPPPSTKSKDSQNLRIQDFKFNGQQPIPPPSAQSSFRGKLTINVPSSSLKNKSNQQQPQSSRQQQLHMSSSENVLSPRFNNFVSQNTLFDLDEELLEVMNSASQKRKEYFQDNFISLRGRSYSKKSIRLMKQYFDQIDEDNKGYITIDDYVRACQNQNSLKFISISLFKYFDRKSCGSITFVDMIKAMIPGLQRMHIEKIIKWVKLNNVKYREIDEEIKKPNDSPRENLRSRQTQVQNESGNFSATLRQKTGLNSDVLNQNNSRLTSIKRR
eukprot:403349747